MNARRKQLKASLAPGVKKLGPASIASKLDKFPLFDSFFDFLLLNFPGLDDFRNLAKFWLFDFPDFLASFLLPPLTPNQITSPLLFPTLSPDMLGNPVIFNIEVSRAVILLKS